MHEQEDGLGKPKTVSEHDIFEELKTLFVISVTNQTVSV